jgi:hypothetical protein
MHEIDEGLEVTSPSEVLLNIGDRLHGLKAV